MHAISRLEGHYKTHTEDEVAAAAARKLPLPPQPQPPAEAAAAAAAAAAVAAAAAQPPPFLNFVNLNRCGVLADAKPVAAAPAAPPPQPQPARRTSEKALSFDLEAAEAKATVAGGTGSYEIYGKIPDNLADGSAQNERGFYGCGICGREFSGLNSLRKHVPIHTRRIQHRCDLCGHVFGKREYLLDHVRSHTGEISPVCAVCKQSFAKSLKLKEHMRLHKNLNADGSVHDILPYR